MLTTAIMNLKGGTGKTITAINTAATLARDYGKRVLLVDADSQANLTEFVSLSPMDKMQIGGLADLLRGGEAFPVTSKIKGCKLLAADDSLMDLDVTKAGNGEADPMSLADYLEKHDSEYDWCIIDCPPGFSAAAIAALIAADSVVIPMKLDAFGIRGMRNLIAQVKNMRKVNAGLEVAGVLPTMFYSGSQTLVNAEKTLAGCGLPMFTHIRRSVKVDDSTFAQLPIFEASPRSLVCRDYRRFVAELMDRMTQEGGDHDGV